MDVGIDVTRQDELAVGVDDPVAFLRNLRAVFDNGLDAVAFDDQGGVGNYLARPGIDRGAVDNRDCAGGRGERGGRGDEKCGKGRRFIGKAVLN